MAALFPVRALWPYPPRDLRSVAVPLLSGMGDAAMVVRAVLADGEHGFASPAAAAAYLRGAARPVEALSIETAGGFPIQSERGLPGQFGHVGIDLLFHLRPADVERLVGQFRAFGTALIRQCGALAVWFGAGREDEDAVANGSDAIDAAMARRHPADPLPLTLVDGAAWLILWPAGAKVDMVADLPVEDGVTGKLTAVMAPWRTRIG